MEMAAALKIIIFIVTIRFTNQLQYCDVVEGCFFFCVCGGVCVCASRMYFLVLFYFFPSHARLSSVYLLTFCFQTCCHHMISIIIICEEHNLKIWSSGLTLYECQYFTSFPGYIIMPKSR